jgi:nucleobase:cation symporter-1, NCS1 family
MTTDTSPELAVYEGRRPTRSGDTALETHGMAPVPEDQRYGHTWRMMTVWFTPNMELSGVFIGTLAVVFGLGFQLGLIAIIAGSIVGAVPVALLCTWGPKTGTGQVPLARIPFGKSIVLPGAVQWLSAIGWIALGCLFGAQGAQLLFHIPFWVGALLVLIVTGAISIFGYELVHQAERWGAAVMIILFAVLTVRIFQHHVALPHNTVHGAALAGAFVLMVTIAVSGAFSWASYGSDYSRYLKPTSSTAGVFWFTMAGMVVSYVWVMTIGLAAASVLGNQTAGGVRTLMGGGVIGVLALIAIVFAAIVSSSMNDYSASLAFQALGARVRRPFISVVVMVMALAAVLWMHAGSTSTRFENILLFTGYWLAPFCAIVMIDWHYHKNTYKPPFLRTALAWRNLASGWPALVSFVAGFGLMVPFMNTSIVVGPVASRLKGADIAFYVGFLVTGILYFVLRRFARPVADSSQPAAAAHAAAVAEPPVPEGSG